MVQTADSTVCGYVPERAVLMIVTFTWFITAVSLTGTVLNVKKHIACFYLWAFGNIAWLAFDLWSNLYSRAVLDAVQPAFAIWGIVEWSKGKHRSAA